MSGTNRKTPQPSKGSPFDPFLGAFLAAVCELGGGYSLQSHGSPIARQLGVDPAFIEALTINARRRSLIEPFYAASPRNTVRWRVSARGQQFLTALAEPGPSENE